MSDCATFGGRPVTLGADAETEARVRRLVQQHGSPLLVFDPQVLRQQYAALTAALPGVRMFYAVKAHPHAAIVRELDALGCGFDVASAGETALLLELGIFGRRTIHTHPIKKDNEIRTALRFGVTTHVVDNLYELRKLAAYRRRVGVLLRVGFRNTGAVVDLARKFGCAPEEVPALLHEAEQLGIHVKGLSFHVGSQCGDAKEHVHAIERCRAMMQQWNANARTPMSVLDIGGGFPADYAQQGLDIQAFCAPIRDALSHLPEDWDVLAEPGRCLIAPAVCSITTVIGKSLRGGTHWYYLDDGVYGSYSGQIYDHAVYPLQLLRDGPTHPSILAGPTCDSIDIVADGVMLPELELGDLVIGHQMGAYTAATKTRFNSLPDAHLVVDELVVCQRTFLR